MDLLHAIHRERTRNGPRLELHTVGQDGQQRQRLDRLIPQHRPGDGFGGDDDLLGECVGGFVPRQGDEQPRLMEEGDEEPPLPRSSDNLPFPSGRSSIQSSIELLRREQQPRHHHHQDDDILILAFLPITAIKKRLIFRA